MLDRAKSRQRKFNSQNAKYAKVHKDAWSLVRDAIIREISSLELRQRVLDIMEPCFPSSTLLPFTRLYMDEGEEEYLLYWMIEGCKVQFNIPLERSVYVYLFHTEDFPSLQGFYQDETMPYEEIRKRLEILAM